MQLFPVAIDYSKSQSLDGTQLQIIRMRVIVDGADLWTEDDPASALADSEIFTKSLTIRDGVAVAIIDTAATDLSQFAEYAPNTDQICVRTFLTIREAGGSSIFDRDDCWDTIQIGPKSCSDWYKLVLALG
jgi:hypothetical protein